MAPTSGRLYVTHDGEFCDQTYEGGPKHLIRATADAPVDMDHAVRVGADREKLQALLSGDGEVHAKQAEEEAPENKDAGPDENKSAEGEALNGEGSPSPDSPAGGGSGNDGGDADDPD